MTNMAGAQGGIAPSRSYEVIFAFTGEAGEVHGYQDEWLPDGTFRYYGEGQVGDMRLVAGNRAIDRHEDDGVRLFLFDMNSGVRSQVLYKGEFRKVRRGEDKGSDRTGKIRRRYFFDLLPLPIESTEAHPESVDVQALFDEGREREIRTSRVERNREAVNSSSLCFAVTATA